MQIHVELRQRGWFRSCHMFRDLLFVRNTRPAAPGDHFDYLKVFIRHVSDVTCFRAKMCLWGAMKLLFIYGVKSPETPFWSVTE